MHTFVLAGCAIWEHPHVLPAVFLQQNRGILKGSSEKWLGNSCGSDHAVLAGMKILLLFIYRILGRIFETIQRYSNVPRFIREVLNVEDVLDRTRTRERKMAKRRFVYEFRPFEVCGIDYRNAPGTSEMGPARKYPNARSGHRIVCNDSAIYVFGGFNPNISQPRPGNNEDNGTSCLFQELWKYDTIRMQWTLLLDANNDLPLELASNAMLLCGDTIMVGFIFRFSYTLDWILLIDGKSLFLHRYSVAVASRSG